ncbi:AraC family transcriptional regulator [Paenibacillus sp. GCM10012303]|jgi:AraC-like DNA-binding protein|uniref:AraC family transcriptional regulator n=1 Tax=Paenibacillus sp. GCM10012303 TaxID=3317340 RepID=UPI00361277B9
MSEVKPGRAPGSVKLAAVRIGSGGRSGKARCEPGWDWRPAPLGDYDLWYVVSGKGDVRLNGELFPVRQGSCFVFRPGDRIEATQHPDDRLTVIYIHFDVTDLRTGEPCDPESSWLPPGYVYTEDAYPLESRMNEVLEADAEEEESEMRDEWFHCLMKLVLLQLSKAGEAGSPETEAEPPISHKQKRLLLQTKQYIKEHIASPIDYDEIAKFTGLTPRYLNRLFKRYTGQSLKAYITSTRVERARHLLAETSMTVGQVAETLGYSDIFFFSKQFKKYSGIPPSTLRAKALPAEPHTGR